MITTDPQDPNDVVEYDLSAIEESDHWDSVILAGELDDFIFPDDDPDTWDHCDTCGVQIRRTALQGTDGWIHEPGAWEQTIRRQPRLTLHGAVPHSKYASGGALYIDYRREEEHTFPRMPGH